MIPPNFAPETWSTRFHAKAAEICAATVDPSHDLAHLSRVVRVAREICALEGARWEVVLPASYFHDFVLVEKNDPRRREASRLSATAATQWLREQGYPEPILPEVAHAIEAHSYSAGIPPRTLEAKIVQDADRLDALGSIGVMRAFSMGGRLNRPFYSVRDPFCVNRAPNDGEFTLDHFYAKLLKLEASLQTDSAREIAGTRMRFMRDFLAQLAREVGSEPEGDPDERQLVTKLGADPQVVLEVVNRARPEAGVEAKNIS
ncbi:MAG: HD domain-containing protein [Bacteriovoracia bacterium]